MVRRRAWVAGLAAALAASTASAQAPPSATPSEEPQEFHAAGQRGLRIEAAPTRSAVQVTGPSIEQTLTLTNQGPAALVELGALEAGRTQLATEWRRTDGSAITGLEPLPRGGALVATVSATAPRSGVYRSRLRLLAAGDRRELWVGYFAVERRPALSSAGALQPPGAAFEQTINLHRTPVEFTFALRNPTAAPLALEPPQILQLRRETNGQSRSVLPGATRGYFDCPDTPGPQTTAVVMPPDGACRGTVSGRNEGAGAYVAQVAVTGADGGQATGDVQVNVRLAWYWAALVTALGSIGGWFVGAFRREWRARSLLAEAAALQRERLARIARRAQSNGLGEITAPTVEAVEDLIQRIQHQPDLEGLAGQLAKLGARIERLDRWQTMEAHLAGSPDADTTRDARYRLRAALQDLKTADEELTALFAQVTKAAIGPAPEDPAAAEIAAAAAPMPPPPSGLDAPMITARTSDAAALIARRRKHIELIVNAVAGAVLIAGAVQAVWANDPTWGDLSDILGLLITAFAIQAGGSVALGQWTGGASSGGPPSATVR